MDKLTLRGMFNIEKYDISHSILLIRRVRVVKKIYFYKELFFFSVFYVEVPARMKNISIEQGSLEDYDYVRSRCSRFNEEGFEHAQVIVLKTEGRKYYVGCWAFKAEDKTFDPFEISIS